MMIGATLNTPIGPLKKVGWTFEYGHHSYTINSHPIDENAARAIVLASWESLPIFERILIESWKNEMGTQ